MTEQEALQEFWDNALHPSLKPEISEEAKAVAMKALEKQIPKKPKDYKRFVELSIGFCSVCGEGSNNEENYCPTCGQAIDREGYRNETQPLE